MSSEYNRKSIQNMPGGKLAEWMDQVRADYGARQERSQRFVWKPQSVSPEVSKSIPEQISDLASQDSVAISAYKRILSGEYLDIHTSAVRNINNEGIKAPSVNVMTDPRRSLDLFYTLPNSLREQIDHQILTPLKNLFDELKAPQVVFGPD